VSDLIFLHPAPTGIKTSRHVVDWSRFDTQYLLWCYSVMFRHWHFSECENIKAVFADRGYIFDLSPDTIRLFDSVQDLGFIYSPTTKNGLIWLVEHLQGALLDVFGEWGRGEKLGLLVALWVLVVCSAVLLS